MSLRRHRLRQTLAALLLLAPAACAGGGSGAEQVVTVTPPDPPSLPGRKPIDVGGAAAAVESTIAVRPLGAPGSQPAPPESAAVPAAVATAAGAAAVPAAYRVAAGDTLFAVSRRFNLPIQAIIRENGLEPPYALRTGQTLTLPQQRIYRVEPGNTLYSISRAFDVDLTDLARANDLAAPFTVIAGQRLVIPSSEATGALPEGQQPATTALAAAAPERPSPPAQTADAPATDAQTADAPATDAPATDAPATDAPATNPPPPAEAAAAADGSIVVVGEPEKQVSAPSPQAVPEPAAAPAAAAPAIPKTPTAVPQPPPRAGGRFLWPVQGKIISDYGSVGDGRHNDGINIAASEGTPVKAAENGVVVYAGNELRGFGNLLLIKHDNGWVTAYAHNSRLLVSRGDTVKRGQTIAEVGATGNVSTPQLHFEVRKGSRAIDPRDLLES